MCLGLPDDHLLCACTTAVLAAFCTCVHELRCAKSLWAYVLPFLSAASYINAARLALKYLTPSFGGMSSHRADAAQEEGSKSFRRPRVNVVDGRVFVYDAASAATLLSEYRIWATPVGVRHVIFLSCSLLMYPARTALLPPLLVTRFAQSNLQLFDTGHVKLSTDTCSMNAVHLPH